MHDRRDMIPPVTAYPCSLRKWLEPWIIRAGPEVRFGYEAGTCSGRFGGFDNGVRTCAGKRAGGGPWRRRDLPRLSECPEMVVVPAGGFMMGSPDTGE